MKPWIKKTLIGLFGASVVLGGLTACSRGHYGHGPVTEERVAEWRGKAVERVGRKLDLNAEQKAKLDVLADKLVAQRKAWIGDGQDPRAEMQALVAGTQFDRAKALALFEGKSRVVQGAGPEVIAALGDFYDSLKPDQQAKVRDFMQHRHGWFHRS